MHVVHIMASAAAGGGATYLRGLLPALKTLGVRSSLITGEDGPLGEEMAAQGIEVVQLDLMQSRLSLRQAKQLSRAVENLAPTLVHAHGTRGAFYVAIGRLSKTYPCFYTAHGIAFRKKQNFLKKWVMATGEWIASRSVAGLASVSEDDLARLDALPIQRGIPQLYIPNPVDTARFRSQDKDEARKRLKLANNAFVVGTVSRLVEQKAVHVLLAAASQVPEAQILIVGEGHLEPALKKQAKALGIACQFLGNRNDVPEILPALDVFVLSSEWEGEPLSLLEAMACGVTCVATDTPGSSAILADGKAGTLVPRGDSAALGKAINGIREDKSKRAKYHEAAQTVVARRTLEVTAAKTLELYKMGLRR